MTDNSYPPPPNYPPKPSGNRMRLAAGIACVVIGVAGFGVAAFALSQEGDDTPKTTVSVSPSPTTEVVADSVTEETTTYDTVDASSFSIDLRTTKRQCFGSAGCNITVEPELTYLADSADIDPDAIYEITYEIHGDESGTVIGTMELTAQTSVSYQSTYLSTSSSATKVTAEITDVIER